MVEMTEKSIQSCMDFGQNISRLEFKNIRVC
jgi:hypothetical protein